MFELSIREDIAAAHFIKGHEGKCKNLHGHTWKVEVTVRHDRLDGLGMVADFTVLKKKLQEVLGPIDHACLNELPFFKENNPTTENIAKYVYGQYKDKVKPLGLKEVRVWESETSSVTYYKE
ncbi:MAG: 6-carboxytetrahydropterin synthase QueD [Candidatus Omnitrophica bacterium]|nr:6-carboxytetrahydropterin synthase QueD [Candidatus Omnitrophota bacterium]